MKVKLSSFDKEKEYDSKHEWDCFCQGGGSGVVFSKKGNYRTAFFEAFPKEPKCFIRGEGKTLEEAEQQAWDRYQKIKTCNHEMERRGRTDGYGYCKHCSYSAMVFEPLTKCCKCGKPTAYAKDYRGKWYCEKHERIKPKNPNPDSWERMQDERRLPRKQKKLLKKYATHLFRKEGFKGKVSSRQSVGMIFYCEDRQIAPLFMGRFKRKAKDYIRVNGNSIIK